MIENRKARYDYTILEEYECGMVLEGWEVKAIVNKTCSIVGSHCKIFNGEIVLLGALFGSAENDQNRTRKLLLHKREIKRLMGKVQEKRLTLVPLVIYSKNNKFKIKIALAQGNKDFDKREIKKERSINNELNKIIKSQKLNSTI